jgi:SAM-dependent methyltransferase
VTIAPSEDVISRCFSPRLEEAYQHIDRMVLQFCFHVARELPIFGGFEPAPEGRYLVQTVRDILAEEGFADPQKRIPGDDTVALRNEARGCCPEAAPILQLLERCHDHAIAFLTGCEPGLNVVFPRGDIGLWERVHSTDAVMSIYADLIPAALAEVLPDGARVLEVGAGVGAVIERCLPLLRQRAVREYWFTDLGKLFVLRGERRYGHESFLRFRVFDLDLPFAQQDIEPGFDVIVGVNVLHSAKNLDFTLRGLRSALNPGGHLILGEGSPPRPGVRWRLDVVFAFLRGWWDVHLDPVHRPRPGFLFPTEWLQLMRLAGYQNATALPGEQWFSSACRGGLIAASRSSHA